MIELYEVLIGKHLKKNLIHIGHRDSIKEKKSRNYIGLNKTSGNFSFLKISNKHFY